MHSLNAPLCIETVTRDGSLVLVVHGELDIATAPRLDEALTDARQTDAASIVVDLGGVTFMDSSALHVLIRHTHGQPRPERVSLTRGSPQARRVFELSGAYEHLPFVSE